MAGISIVELGRIGYAEAERLQKRLVKLRQRGAVGDVLLLLEHRAVVTLGRNAHTENVLLTVSELAAQGVEVAECDRGGDVTFHGPGQLVGYPIVDLRGLRRPASLPARSGRLELGPVDYVRVLETGLIAAVAEFGVAAQRIAGRTGVWTVTEPAAKLAAIGVHISRGVTSHGFALNVAADVSGFRAIVPCGIRDAGVTSLEAAAGRRIEPEQVRNAVAAAIPAAFEQPAGPRLDLDELPEE